jgi:hypothetical protein
MSAYFQNGYSACLCGCGRAVSGKAVFGSVACRKRAERRRSQGRNVTVICDKAQLGSWRNPLLLRWAKTNCKVCLLFIRGIVAAPKGAQ